MESLTTTRPGVWLPTSCTLCAHERSPENDEPPKIYSNRNIFLLLCIISYESMKVGVLNMNNKFLLEKIQPTMSQIRLEG
jgi:hypothetical protein